MPVMRVMRVMCVMLHDVHHENRVESILNDTIMGITLSLLLTL